MNEQLGLYYISFFHNLMSNLGVSIVVSIGMKKLVKTPPHGDVVTVGLALGNNNINSIQFNSINKSNSEVLI